MTEIQPLRDQALLKVLEANTETKGGIVLPDSAKEKPQEGEVVAVGEGKFSQTGATIPLQVKVGDRVLFAKYSGTEVTTKKGKEYLIVKEEDILAVIK